MNKQALKKYYLEKRKAIGEDELLRKSNKIKDLFFKHFSLNDIYTLHVFLPIKKNKEVDTWLIINELWKDYKHVQLLSSRSNLTTYDMPGYALNPDTLIEENIWGIPEPVNNGQAVDYGVIDMVLVPLIIFDQQGHRLGYGKGFYDRFLKKCKPEVIKIGLSLESPVDTIDDISSHDVGMNFCITPDDLYCFDNKFGKMLNFN